MKILTNWNQLNGKCERFICARQYFFQVEIRQNGAIVNFRFSLINEVNN